MMSRMKKGSRILNTGVRFKLRVVSLDGCSGFLLATGIEGGGAFFEGGGAAVSGFGGVGLAKSG